MKNIQNGISDLKFLLLILLSPVIETRLNCPVSVSNLVFELCGSLKQILKVIITYIFLHLLLCSCMSVMIYVFIQSLWYKSLTKVTYFRLLEGSYALHYLKLYLLFEKLLLKHKPQHYFLTRTSTVLLIYKATPFFSVHYHFLKRKEIKEEECMLLVPIF